MGWFASHFGWRLSTAFQPGNEKTVSVRQRDRQGFGPSRLGIVGEDLLRWGEDPAAGGLLGAQRTAPAHPAANSDALNIQCWFVE